MLMPDRSMHEMKPPKGESPATPPSDGPAPLESVLCTEELNRRGPRAPDYEAESRALAALAVALANSPHTVLQTLAETTLDVLQAGSAGLSLLTTDEKKFNWSVVAGAWKAHVGGSTPRDFSPSGDVLDLNVPLLFRQLERRYPYFRLVRPRAEECLLVPVSVGGKAVGTLWAIAHDERKFDAEDLRLLASLGRFAASAYQVQTLLAGALDARRAALNLMEDAVQSREVLETLNAESREREDRYRTLFELGPVAVYSCDTAGVIREFNHHAAQLWGREPAAGDTDERFCGSFKMFRPDGSFMPHAQCPMAQVVSGEIPAVHDGEVQIERPDGSRITVVVNIRPVKNPQGELTGAINCFYDITERSRLERETQEQAAALADLHHRKDEFLAMLSHELRNPLAPIVNAVELLGRQSSDNPFQHQVREIIARQVGQLKHLIDDLLEVSRITSGRIQLQKERITAADIVQRAAETARPLIAARRHELDVSLPPQPIWLHADPSRLEQVVVNLLTNAAKYTDQDGHIWLSVEQEGDAAVLRVRDSGIGIPAELLPHIFELFTQAERSLDRSEGGLGIGLSLVRRLVELHAGTVEVFSLPGQGSEFVVRLPVMQSSTLPSPSPSTDIPRTAGKSRRVLIVDDNVDTAHTLAMLLKTAGHDVRMAHDGPTALEAALDYSPDVVLLDIGLPGYSGYEVAKRIREQPTLGNVVLVALTGYGQETDRQRSQDSGLDHYLVKPADFGQVQEILATTM